MKPPFAWYTSLLLGILGLLGTGFSVGCMGRINVMGRDVPESEYRASYDALIAREKQGLEPTGAHDEHGRIPSWDQFWCNMGGTTAVPPTAQSRRLKRYIIEKRRALGLKELTCGLDYIPSGRGPNGAPGSFRPDRFFKPGDPRIFQ